MQCVVAAEASLGKNEFDDAAIETSSGYRSEAASRTVHHSVIRGLVAVLMPWEHSKRSQQAALLVLGNMIENDLENDLEKDLQSNPEHGPDDAKEIAGSVVDVRGDGDETPAAWGSRGCVEALADALAAQSFVGTEDGGDDAVDDVRWVRVAGAAAVVVAASAERHCQSTASLQFVQKYFQVIAIGLQQEVRLTNQRRCGWGIIVWKAAI